MNAMLQKSLSLLQNHVPVKAENITTGDHIARSLLLQILQQVKHGRLALFDETHAGNTVKVFGSLHDADDINASLTVHDSSFWNTLLTRGSMGAAEAYIAGHWSSPDLTQLVRLMLRNRNILGSLDSDNSLLARMTMKAMHLLKRNTTAGSRQNIRAHYDLSNDFFQLFLDPQMMYSSAIFRHPSESLAEASTNKLERVCQQLQLQASDHLLEIGSGWGGLAIYAAQHYGCKVTTTTISEQQFALATDRIAAAGLQDRITLLQQDYRELQGEYDKLVSIEMIEAVGAEFQRGYFEICNRLLKSGGLALFQAITIDESLYTNYLNSTDFIRQYIFPGGCLPTLSSMQTLCAAHTQLQLQNIHDMTQDYAHTLQAWRQQFLFNSKQVIALGFDIPFIRLWDYYLCYCEGGFLEGSTGTYQLLFQKNAQ